MCGTSTAGLQVLLQRLRSCHGLPLLLAVPRDKVTGCPTFLECTACSCHAATPCQKAICWTASPRLGGLFGCCPESPGLLGSPNEVTVAFPCHHCHHDSVYQVSVPGLRLFPGYLILAIAAHRDVRGGVISRVLFPTSV